MQLLGPSLTSSRAIQIKRGSHVALLADEVEFDASGTSHIRVNLMSLNDAKQAGCSVQLELKIVPV